MSKKQEFINFVTNLMSEANIGPDHMTEGAQLYWETLINEKETEKPLFTDNGKMILKFLQDNPTTPTWKSRDIAEGMFISAKTVAGAMRKLVSDGYIEKLGESPIIYTLTENGKNIVID